jgi:hypothetical protein
VVLPTDASGVKVLDELLNSMRTAMRPNLLSRLVGRKSSADEAAAVSASLGAHLCELLQLNTPGKWEYVEFEGVRQVVLVLSPGNYLAVPQKTGKQFLNGNSNSIGFFFGLAAAFAMGRAVTASMSPEERIALKEKVARRKAAGKVRKERIAKISREEGRKWNKAVRAQLAERIATARAKREAAEKEQVAKPQEQAEHRQALGSSPA